MAHCKPSGSFLVPYEASFGSGRVTDRPRHAACLPSRRARLPTYLLLTAPKILSRLRAPALRDVVTLRPAGAALR